MCARPLVEALGRFFVADAVGTGDADVSQGARGELFGMQGCHVALLFGFARSVSGGTGRRVSVFAQAVSDFAVLQGAPVAGEILAGAEFAGGDAEVGAEGFGQRLRAGVAVFEGKRGDIGLAVEELVGDVFQTQAAQVGSQRFAGYGGEDAVKVIRREGCQRRDGGEVGRVAVVLFKVADDGLQATVVVGAHGATMWRRISAVK